MFIGLLIACIRESFGESLVSNLNGLIKWLTLSNQPCQGRPSLVIIKYAETLSLSIHY